MAVAYRLLAVGCWLLARSRLESGSVASQATSETPFFRYDPAIIDAFPTIRAAAIRVVDIAPGNPAALEDEYRSQQSVTIERLGRIAIAGIPSVAAWRRAFSRFGVKPTQHRSAIESLLRRLSKQGHVPTINPLVDIGNLVSIRHALPVAVFDLDRISAPITVQFAGGDEAFHGIGANGPDNPAPGEVIFVDAGGSVCARRWCWRQSAESAAGDDSTRVLFVIEGHHESGAEDVLAAGRDVADLASRHLGANVASFELLP